MGKRLLPKIHFLLILLAAGAALLLLAVAPVAGSAQARKSAKSVSKEELVELLERGVPGTEVENVVRQYGVSFELTRQLESQLREAGATDGLLKTIRQHAPRPASRSTHPAAAPAARPASPPVLLIEFSPGGAEAYVDDEPVGTTSPEGRLRLSRLDPGQHRVRLALEGYRDYEQKVELVAGKTAKVGGTLQTAKAAVPANPEPAGTPARTEVASNPAYLGVAFVPNQPAGAKGVVISGAEPGSPAERAGLRPYNVILGIGGRQVTTPAALQEAIAGHQAGDVVDLTVYDGKQTVTRRVQLASRAAAGPSGRLSGAAAAIATMSGMAGQASNPNLAYFYVAHDHGPPAPNFCVGILTLGNGMIKYRSSSGIHPLDIPFAEIKEAKKNSVYLAAFGGFHVRLAKGTVYNFAVIDNAGQYQRPDALLAALDRAVGK